MDKKSKTHLSIVLSGYIFSLGFYFIWCFYFFNGRLYSYDYLLVIAVAVFAITAVYLFPLLLIWYIKPFQKVWTSFSIVSIITLLIFFLIPPANSLIYYMSTEKKRMEEIETKLKFEIAMNDATKKLITELQVKLKIERKENVKLRKQLNEKIRKTKSLKEEHNTKEDVVVQAKSNSGTKNQEIIFKVQIISSSTRLATNSPQFKGLKNVWEYKDSDLYKYTVGNQIDLKSASALQSEFRRKGFNGAFAVAFKNGKRIPVREALRLLN